MAVAEYAGLPDEESPAVADSVAEDANVLDAAEESPEVADSVALSAAVSTLARLSPLVALSVSEAV